jgi:hypothetical protein
MNREFRRIRLKDNDTIPVLAGNLEPKLLTGLKTTLLKIKNNKPTSHNKYLAGAIREEYTVEHQDVLEILYFLDEMYGTYYDVFSPLPETRQHVNFSASNQAEIGKLWVNFQKKHEFNPIHHHDGLVSFVIWVQIPFDIKKEQKLYNNGTVNFTSQFQFVYRGLTHDIVLNSFPVEKDWEGTVLMFPASLNHCVYPFYTSDGYRISVSGNISLPATEELANDQ